MIDDDLVYVGGYTAGNGGTGEGIAAARRDPRSGSLHPLGVVARTEAPSFLAHHPTLPVLYAANELAQGAVSGWAVQPGGALRALGSRATGGGHPCHLAVLPDGGHLVAANYGTGSVALHPLDPAGVVGERTDLAEHRGHGPDRERQEGPHAHMVSVDPDGRHVRAVDLGADVIHGYAVDGGRLRPKGPELRTRPGAGPRHLARGVGGWLYVAGELDATVTAYRPDPGTGELAEAARVAASAESGPVFPAEIAVDADARRLYLANRGPDTIAVFALEDGVPRYLTEVATGGRWPRHFALYAGFLYIANERSHTVVTFELSAPKGVPVATGAVLETPSPTCVLPAPRK
jgi:6-phosphogluconolactonase